MPPSDAEPPDFLLVERAQRGDDPAFTLLFRRYYERLRVFAYRIVLDGAAADDIAQEAFIRAARQLGRLRAGQAFAAWIYQITTNAARDHARAQRSHQRKLAAAAVDATAPPARAPDLDGQVVEALALLSVPERAAVALVYLEECSHAEAARRLGCAETTVSWRVFLARRKLRARLKP